MGEKKGIFEDLFEVKQQQSDNAAVLSATDTEMLAAAQSNIPLTEGELKKLGKTVIGAD